MTSDHSNIPKVDKPNELRRRLAKGGLAAPIVLASLVSKPVLALPGNPAPAPYTCTISGQLSGNTSSHEVASCNTLGQGQSEWLANPYTDTNPATLSGFGVPDYFFFDGTNLSTSSSYPVATIHQILSLPAPTGLESAKKAVVLLLNAKNNTDPTIYPLTESQAQRLFIAAATNTSFIDTDPDVNWDPAHVSAFIDLLYH